MVKSNKLEIFKSIKHCFYSKNGGFSKGLYNSLNCSYGSKDNPENITKNQAKIATDFQAKSLLVCNQVHKADVVVVNNVWDNQHESPKADAMVTKKTGLALGILTADCVPLLFSDAKNGVIGAAHCGWGSAYLGLATKTVDEMLKIGAKLENIVVALGPSIKQQSYEVDKNFRLKFLEQNEANKNFFISQIDGQQSDKYLFDLPAYLVKNLYNRGIKNIDVIDEDTYIQPNKFFSYRRSCHNNEEDYGRQISVIMLN